MHKVSSLWFWFLFILGYHGKTCLNSVCSGSPGWIWILLVCTIGNGLLLLLVLATAEITYKCFTESFSWTFFNENLSFFPPNKVIFSVKKSYVWQCYMTILFQIICLQRQVSLCNSCDVLFQVICKAAFVNFGRWACFNVYGPFIWFCSFMKDSGLSWWNVVEFQYGSVFLGWIWVSFGEEFELICSYCLYNFDFRYFI